MHLCKCIAISNTASAGVPFEAGPLPAPGNRWLARDEVPALKEHLTCGAPFLRFAPQLSHHLNLLRHCKSLSPLIPLPIMHKGLLQVLVWGLEFSSADCGRHVMWPVTLLRQPHRPGGPGSQKITNSVTPGAQPDIPSYYFYNERRPQSHTSLSPGGGVNTRYVCGVSRSLSPRGLRHPISGTRTDACVAGLSRWWSLT